MIMIDILVYLFARYGEYESRPEPETLVRKLKAAGFEDDDIGDAMQWLSALKPTGTDAPVGTPQVHSFRLWSADEQRKLDSTGIGFITFLDHAGVLTPALREFIVDRLLALEETPVPLAKLKVLTLMVLWSHQRDLESLLVEELLAEPGQTLH